MENHVFSETIGSWAKYFHTVFQWRLDVAELLDLLQVVLREPSEIFFYIMPMCVLPFPGSYVLRAFRE